MSSIVIQLQEQALDNSVTCGDLLRKSFVVAKKLALNDFEIWTQNELNGYVDNELPKYRILRGEIEAWNPYNGWVPAIFEDPKEAEALSKRGVAQSIAELEDILLDSNDGNGSLHIPFPKHIELKLMRAGGLGLRPLLRIGRAQIIGIVNAVRNTILKWSLELEADGILGEGLRFSSNEKQIAGKANYNITTYINQMTNSQIQQLSDNSDQSIEGV